MMTLPPTATPKIGSSNKRNAGRSSSGTLNVMPSSPPVTSDSWEARIAKNDATASVTIAKKIALTRNENNPTRKDSTKEATTAPAAPARIEVQVGPNRV